MAAQGTTPASERPSTPACQETLRAALDRHHPPPPRLSDAERDAELVRLAAGVADQRAQLVLERKQRRPW